jgi:hypothetical protein
MRFGSGCRWLAVIWVEQDLPLQQHTGDPEQPIGDAAQGATGSGKNLGRYAASGAACRPKRPSSTAALTWSTR